MTSSLRVHRNDSTSRHEPGEFRGGGQVRQAVQRIFGRQREYASRKEYAERVMTVSLATTYRLGPWL